MKKLGFGVLRNSLLWPQKKDRWHGKPEEGAPLRHLTFSKEMVALSLLLIIAGTVMLMGPWAIHPLVGATIAAVGLGILLTAGIYWACGNEGCY